MMGDHENSLGMPQGWCVKTDYLFWYAPSGLTNLGGGGVENSSQVLNVFPQIFFGYGKWPPTDFNAIEMLNISVQK